MTELSVSTLLRAELQRLRAWLTDSPTLDDVEAIPTIGDQITQTNIGRRLPDGWCVERDIVQFEGESVAEVGRLTHSGDGYRITLKPVDLRAPTKKIKIYSRRSPFESRHHRTTVDSLSAAIEEAERLAATHDQRARQSTGRERRAVDR